MYEIREQVVFDSELLPPRSDTERTNAAGRAVVDSRRGEAASSGIVLQWGANGLKHGVCQRTVVVVIPIWQAERRLRESPK